MQVVTYVGIILFCGVLIGYNGRDVFVIFLSILLSFPALIGMYGVGLIFGCISILEKNVGSLIFLVQTILLFISNTLAPSRGQWGSLIPFSCGIDIMRNVYMKQNVTIDSILTYIIVNMTWVIIGSVCFRIALKHERAYGSFDNY